MKEIRMHGRGGNGAFTAVRLLGQAASVYSGMYGQAFPSFGPERRGAPVLAFSRIDSKPITDHSQVYDCDAVVILDETLIEVVDVLNGLKDDGVLVVNTCMSVDECKKRYGFEKVKNVKVIDATGLALEILGNSIVNTAMLGAAVAATDVLSIDAVEKAVASTMSPNLVAKNQKIVKVAYDKMKEGC